jgi:hypothetical protein
MGIELLPNLVDEEAYAGVPNLVDSCMSFDVALSFSYLGEPLRDTPISVTGLGYNGSGTSVRTDSEGKVRSSIYYDKSDFPGYAANPYYSVTLGRTVIDVPGPTPISFRDCT